MAELAEFIFVWLIKCTKMAKFAESIELELLPTFTVPVNPISAIQSFIVRHLQVEGKIPRILE